MEGYDVRKKDIKGGNLLEKGDDELFLTLHLFQCKIFSRKYFYILPYLFCSKIFSQK